MVRLRSKTNRETERGSSGEPYGLRSEPSCWRVWGQRPGQPYTGIKQKYQKGKVQCSNEKGFQNEPVRCRECRNNRKNASRSENREMHDAVCAECGAPTKVPFLPRNDKPIYCSACYAKHRAQR